MTWVVQREGEHTYNFPRRLNNVSQGKPRGPTLSITIEAPSRGISRLFEKINEIDKLLNRLIKKKRERTKKNQKQNQK